MTIENKNFVRKFNNFLLEQCLSDKINVQQFLNKILLTYILLYGKRIKTSSHNDVIGFKFKNKKDYVILHDGRKITGVGYVVTSQSIGFIINNEVQSPLMEDDLYVEILKNVFKENDV